MPDTTPDYKAEIKSLTELVLTLFIKHAALEKATLRFATSVSSGEISQAEKEVAGALEKIPEIQDLRKQIDRTTLQALISVLKNFRG